MIHGAWSRRRRLSMSSGAQRKRARRPTRLGWTTSGRPSRRLAACAMWSWLRSAAPTAGAAHVGPHPPAHRAAIGPQPPFQGTVASICMELPLRMQRAIAVCEGGGGGGSRLRLHVSRVATLGVRGCRGMQRGSPHPACKHMYPGGARRSSSTRPRRQRSLWAADSLSCARRRSPRSRSAWTLISQRRRGTRRKMGREEGRVRSSHPQRSSASAETGCGLPLVGGRDLARSGWRVAAAVCGGVARSGGRGG